MLSTVDPLLKAVEALPREGSYTVTFVMPDGQERAIVTTAQAGKVVLPSANLPDGWNLDSPTFQAALAAINAVHQARELAGAGRVLLLDVEGGWDVSIGNVVLSTSGIPSCVGDGDMEQTAAGVWKCTVCGAGALLSAD
jgi:hypothetical protein